MIVSRSGNDYSRLGRGVRSVEDVTVRNLTPDQIISYIEEQFPGNAELGAWEPVFAELSDSKSLLIKALETNWRVSAAVTFGLLGRNPADLLPADDECKQSAAEGGYLDRAGRLLMDSFVTSRIVNHGIPNSRVLIVKAHLRALAAVIAHPEKSPVAGSEIILHHWWKQLGEQRIMRRHRITAWLATQFPWSFFGIFVLLFPLRPDWEYRKQFIRASFMVRAMR